MKKGIKILCIIVILVLVGSGILVLVRSRFSNEASRSTVLCQARYSPLIEGNNQPIANVDIAISEVGTNNHTPLVYTTDSNGYADIPFTKGKTYNITIIYKNVKKTSQLKYNGEYTLFVLINPHEPVIHDIKFVAVFPSTK